MRNDAKTLFCVIFDGQSYLVVGGTDGEIRVETEKCLLSDKKMSCEKLDGKFLEYWAPELIMVHDKFDSEDCS